MMEQRRCNQEAEEAALTELLAGEILLQGEEDQKQMPTV